MPLDAVQTQSVLREDIVARRNGKCTKAYRTVTDLKGSGEDLQVVDKVGVPSHARLNSLNLAVRLRAFLLRFSPFVLAP
jgi:hypothetical protein